VTFHIDVSQLWHEDSLLRGYNDERVIMFSLLRSLVSGLTLLFVLSACGGGGSSVEDGRLPADLKELTSNRFMASVLFDADGDGDQDLALGSIDRDDNPRDRLLLNDGKGVFTFADKGRLPLRYGGANYGTVELHARDFDGDGDQDVIASVHGPLDSNPDDAELQFYLNDGTGQFSDATTTYFPAGIHGGDVTILDFDSDTDLDLLVAPGFGTGFPTQIYTNDGSGVFTASSYTGFTNFNELKAADVDSDGDLDIVDLPSISFNNGSNSLTSTFFTIDTATNSIMHQFLTDAAGGNPLIVAVQFEFLSHDGLPIKVFQLDGMGVLIDVSITLFPDAPNAIHPRNFHVRDFDGNGTQDLLIADHGFDSQPFPGAQNILILQNLDGSLIDGTDRLPQLSDFSHDIAVGDVDGDGDIDIFTSNLQNSASPGVSHLSLNDGAGNFSLER
jgi:hypothetical protein